MTRKVRVTKGAPKRPKYNGSVRHFKLNRGLPTVEAIRSELAGYRDVLLGEVDPPTQKGVMTLMEVAEAYFSRACELEQLILEAQRQGTTVRKEYQQVRTQEIRSFKEMAKSAAELGSRRITFENLRMQQEQRGRESI